MARVRDGRRRGDDHEKAKDAGARILLEKMVVPGVTFGVLVDPTGATLGVWQVQKQ